MAAKKTGVSVAQTKPARIADDAASAMDKASTTTAEALVGKVAPAIDVPIGGGGRFRLEDARGKTVILYFYPRDLTPGCTLEAQDFEAARALFTKRNAVIIGVSRDTEVTHAKFKAKYSLGFALLSDVDGSIVRDFGVWQEKSLYGKKSLGIVRTTFVIGPDGVVKHVFSKVKVAGHVDAVLAKL
jgi:peroxiredoxin Q/BCP